MFRQPIEPCGPHADLADWIGCHVARVSPSHPGSCRAGLSCQGEPFKPRPRPGQGPALTLVPEGRRRDGLAQATCGALETCFRGDTLPFGSESAEAFAVAGRWRSPGLRADNHMERLKRIERPALYPFFYSQVTGVPT